MNSKRLKCKWIISLPVIVMFTIQVSAANSENASWIWAYPDEPAPKNRFTYFRKVVELESVPENAVLKLAADSNTQLWINGSIVRRKMARYNEMYITAEVINAGPYLNIGKNVIVALHHNWGDIITFQRTDNKHAGLYLESSWVVTDVSWKYIRAPEFRQHEKQIVGIAGDAPRIRYPVIIDGRKIITDNIHDASFDDSKWDNAFIVKEGPWSIMPQNVETPGQREHKVRPMKVIGAGKVQEHSELSPDPFSMASEIRNAKLETIDAAEKNAEELINGKSLTIHGKSGETHYVTFDFFLPVHGYPYIELADSPEFTVIDFGYAEIYESLYSGERHVDVSGWINPEGVIGAGYADRYLSREGAQSVEIPDERTARWMTLHIHFTSDGELVINDIGIVKSQYPIERIGNFSCGNEWMDRIVKLCEIHAEICMSDAYIDTPGREDGQWLEDSRLRALIASHWYNDINLRRLLLRTHVQQQGADGDFHPFAPSNYPAYPAPYDWSVQWVAMLYDDYIWTGETDLLHKYWRNMVSYWENVLALVDENGIWLTRRVLADIRTGLRCRTNEQSSGIVTPWIIERLRWSVEMADAIGERDQAAVWRAISDQMTEAFRKYHIVPKVGSVPAHVGDRLDPKNLVIERGYSQAGQTVAVFSGLLNPEEAFASVDYAFSEPEGSPPDGVFRWNNPTYSYRSLLALSHVGLTDRAVRHLIERYSPYLPGHPNNQTPLELQGPYGGPLPEYWVNRKDLNLEPGEINTTQPIDETGSHGWGCVPLQWLHDTLLGVTISEPGGSRISIAPDAGGLPYVSGHVGMPKGRVWVHWDPQQWKLQVTIPGKVEAKIVMPAVCRDKRVRCVESPGTVEEQDGNIFLITGGGSYIFEAF